MTPSMAVMKPIHKKEEFSDCNIFIRLSLLETTYKIFENIVEEVVCGTCNEEYRGKI